MAIFTAIGTRAILVAALCLGGVAHAQVAPLQYWIPGGPFGLGSGSSDAGGAGNLAGFDAGDARGLSDWRDTIPTGSFVRGESGGVGLSGLGRVGAFGNVGGYSYDSAVAGYNFKGVGGLPVSVYAGFDTLKFNPGFGGPLAPFSTDTGTPAGTVARAGIAFQPAPNVSLSLEAGFAQHNAGRLDSDIRSPLLPGQSPVFIGR